MISTTLTCAITSLMQPKFLLAIIHMFLNVLNYAPTKCKFTFIGVFNCCATNPHLGLKVELVWHIIQGINNLISPTM
jgi:hypothetical protein